MVQGSGLALFTVALGIQVLGVGFRALGIL